jgi:hypothetical protein
MAVVVAAPRRATPPGRPRARVHAKEGPTRDVATGRVTGGSDARDSLGPPTLRLSGNFSAVSANAYLETFTTIVL